MNLSQENLQNNRKQNFGLNHLFPFLNIQKCLKVSKFLMEPLLLASIS